MSRLHVGPQRGITLMELLVAMSIFSVLGLFLFVLTSRSLEIYRSASGTAEYQDRWDRTLMTLSEDLRCVWPGDLDGPGPSGMLLLARDRTAPKPPTDAEGQPEPDATREAVSFAGGDPRTFALRLVRTLPNGELGDTVTRFAGTTADRSAYIDGVDDLVESGAFGAEEAEGGLRAPAGTMEVLWFLDRDPADEPGSWTLYRATRSPVGGAGSLLASTIFDAMDRDWIRAHAVAVVSGLAAFDLAFSAAPYAGVAPGEGGGAVFEETWDSTRGRLPTFSLHRGAASLAHSADDVFPARAAVTATFLGEARAAPDAVLTQAIEPGTRSFTISVGDLFEEDEPAERRLLRIGDEWIRVEDVSDRQLRVQRGARGTVASRHPAGSEIVVGRSYRRVLPIPAHRPALPSPGEKR